jgi:hypothetical protein
MLYSRHGLDHPYLTGGRQSPTRDGDSKPGRANKNRSYILDPVQKQDVVYHLVGVKVVVKECGWKVAGSTWWGLETIANCWIFVVLRVVAAFGGSVVMTPVLQCTPVTVEGVTIPDSEDTARAFKPLVYVVIFVAALIDFFI